MNPIDIYIQSMKIMCPSIEDTHLEEFKSSLTIKTFNKGEYVFQVNEKHEFILFITTGLVRAYYMNQKGDEKNAWFVKENEFITDYPSFLQSCPSNYAFQCLENTTAVLLSKKAIIEAYCSLPKLRTGCKSKKQKIDLLHSPGNGNELC
jgi:CRP-like cAMP-binding protein